MKSIEVYCQRKNKTTERKNDDDDSVKKRKIRRWKENDQGGKSLTPVKGTSYSILISKERDREVNQEEIKNDWYCNDTLLGRFCLYPFFCSKFYL